MGYTTDFQGQLNFDRVLTNEEVNYIKKFNDSRRMKRDVSKLYEIYKGEGGNPFLPKEQTYGNEGEYFVGGTGHAGQDRDDSISITMSHLVVFLKVMMRTSELIGVDAQNKFKMVYVNQVYGVNGLSMKMELVWSGMVVRSFITMLNGWSILFNTSLISGVLNLTVRLLGKVRIVKIWVKSLLLIMLLL